MKNSINVYLMLFTICLLLFCTTEVFSKEELPLIKQPVAIIISDSIYQNQLNAIAPLLKNDYGLDSFEFSKTALTFRDPEWRSFIEEKITKDDVELLLISMGLRSFYSVKSNQLLLYSIAPKSDFAQAVSNFLLFPRLLFMDIFRWMSGFFQEQRKQTLSSETLKDNNSFFRNLEVAMMLKKDSEFSLYKQFIVLRSKGPLYLLKSIRKGEVSDPRNRSFLKAIAYNILKQPEESYKEIKGISFKNRYLKMITDYLVLQLEERKQLCEHFKNIDTILGKNYIELQVEAICSPNRSDENQEAYNQLSTDNKNNPIHIIDPVYYLWPDTPAKRTAFVDKNLKLYRNSEVEVRHWAASRLYLFVHHKNLEKSYSDLLQEINDDVSPIIRRFIKYKYGYKNLIALRNELLRLTSLPYRNLTLTRLNEVSLDMNYIKHICSNVRRILILGYPIAKSDFHYKVKDYCQKVAIFEPSDAKGFSHNYLSDGIHYNKRGMTWLNAHLKNIFKECYGSDHWRECVQDQSRSKQ